MDTGEAVEFVGVQAVLVAAGLHLLWGGERAVFYLRAGLFTDPRPFVFVISGLVLVLGVVHLYAGDPSGRGRRRVYWFFVAVLVLYLIGYALWHAAGHPTFATDGGLLSVRFHGGNPVANVIDHLANDAFALVNALVELIGIAAFAWLLATGRTPSSAAGD